MPKSSDYVMSRLYLGYFTSFFPALAHTFISREVKGLTRLGLNIKCFSVHKPPRELIPEEDRELVQDTFYIFPINIFGFICSHIYYVFSRPAKYLNILFFLLTKRNLRLKDRIRNLYHFSEAVYMAKEIEDNNIKHLHVHFASGPATSAMIISNLLGVSFSFTAHGSDLFLDELLLEEKITSAKFIITISNYNKAILSNIVHEANEKVSVVYCGVDPHMFLPCHKKTPTITILSVGRLVWQKGYCYLIEACRILRKNGFQFHCIIIGEGPEREKLQRLICEHGLDDLVELKGKVFQDKIQSYYDLADIFVSPSISEGIPVVLMEAMCKEIPVIATRITGIPELIQHRNSGFLISPGNVEKLAEALALLIKNDGLRKKLGKNGRKKVLREFNLKRNLKTLKGIFESQIC